MVILRLLSRYGISKILAIIIVAVLIAGIGIGLFVYVQWTYKKPVTPQKPQQQAGGGTTQGIVLRVITRHPWDILDKAKQLFLKSEIAKKYHIVNIEWLPVDPSEWVEVIKASAKKPGREIDVAWGGGPTLFDFLAMQGLLKPITSKLVLDELKDIPKSIGGAPLIRYDSKGRIFWIAAAISSFGFTINKKALQRAHLPIPKRWIDLANETYAKTLPIPSVGVACPTRSTSNTRMYEIILQIYGWKKGWEVITLMGANAKIYDESGLVRDAVIRGDICVGITIDFYGYTAQIENPGVCQYIIPEDGTVINGDPIALLNTTKHPEAAQAFIAWVLSPEGQSIWLDKKINRLPANPKVFETPAGKQRPDLKKAYDETLKKTPIEFSDQLALSYEEAMRWFFYATITEAHSKLQQAWKLIVKAKESGKINEVTFKKLIEELTDPTKLTFQDPKFGTCTFTQSYAQKINKYIITDVNYKYKLIEAWYKAALARYDKVIKEVKAILGG